VEEEWRRSGGGVEEWRRWRGVEEEWRRKEGGVPGTGVEPPPLSLQVLRFSERRSTTEARLFLVLISSHLMRDEE